MPRRKLPPPATAPKPPKEKPKPGSKRRVPPPPANTNNWVNPRNVPEMNPVIPYKPRRKQPHNPNYVHPAPPPTGLQKRPIRKRPTKS